MRICAADTALTPGKVSRVRAKHMVQEKKEEMNRPDAQRGDDSGTAAAGNHNRTAADKRDQKEGQVGREAHCSQH